MPRQARDVPPTRRQREAARTIFGQPWPLPVSPAVAGLLLALVVAAGLAWYFEGRYTTTPAEAAKLVTPYTADQVKQVVLTSALGTATYTRDPSTGKFAPPGGAQPTPSPVPSANATPAPVELSPETKLESLLNQLHDLQIDRVIDTKPSNSAEYGLDQPQLTLQLIPKSGAPAGIAIGKLNPNQTSYYVRRDAQKDTALVARYTLDDLIQVANGIIAPGSSAATPMPAAAASPSAP